MRHVAAPMLGQHTEQVLGLDASRMAVLRERGIIGAADSSR